MPFITDDDYKKQIKETNLLAMIEDDLPTREDAELSAISQVKDYLFQLYDTDAIFDATGTDRHPYLVRCVINVILYILHQRLPKRMIPDLIQKNYDETITYLERVNDGKIAADLPPLLKEDDSPRTMFRWGSSEPRTY